MIYSHSHKKIPKRISMPICFSYRIVLEFEFLKCFVPIDCSLFSLSHTQNGFGYNNVASTSVFTALPNSGTSTAEP